MSATSYEVIGKPKVGGKALVLRRFPTEYDAIGHAQKVDRGVWEDVWVVPRQREIPQEMVEPPPFPWSVLWAGGYAYIVDANGKKLASLLGSQKQREFVAEIVSDLGTTK